MFTKNSDVTAENVRQVTVRNNKRAAIDFSGNRLFKQRIVSLYLIQRDEARDRVELELYRAVIDYVTAFYELATRQNNRTMMFLLLIYQRMVSSSSRAILKSLSVRLATLEESQRCLAKQEENAPPEELNWDHLEELTTEEQLAELNKTGAGYPFGALPAALTVEIAALKRCVSLARQAATGRNDVKFTRLLEIVDEFKIRENSPRLKFIIFTEFVETQAYLQENLSNLGYHTALINGSMPIEERIAQVERFRQQAQFLISTDAGGGRTNSALKKFIWTLFLNGSRMRRHWRQLPGRYMSGQKQLLRKNGLPCHFLIWQGSTLYRRKSSKKEPERQSSF